MSRRSAQRPVLITGAPQSASEEARRRRVQYLATMGIRVICFVVAVAVAVPVVRIVAIAGACILPYVAVVGANTVRRVNPSRSPAYYIPGPQPQLKAGVGARPHEGGR